MVVSSSQRILTDTWVKATWDEFVAVAYDPAYVEGRAYFDTGRMRIEMASVGVGQGRQSGVVWDVVTFFVIARKLNITQYMSGSFRKVGEQEFQPDMAFYICESATPLPPQNNLTVNIDLFGSPTLVVEVGASSLSDDLGAKRLLYERVGVKEYWVVDVEGQKVVAFSIESGRSGQIHTSGVLPGLDIGVIEEAVRRWRSLPRESQSENDGAISQWLMKTFE